MSRSKFKIFSPDNTEIVSDVELFLQYKAGKVEGCLNLVCSISLPMLLTEMNNLI